MKKILMLLLLGTVFMVGGCDDDKRRVAERIVGPVVEPVSNYDPHVPNYSKVCGSFQVNYFDGEGEEQCADSCPSGTRHFNEVQAGGVGLWECLDSCPAGHEVELIPGHQGRPARNECIEPCADGFEHDALGECILSCEEGEIRNALNECTPL